MPLVNNGTAPDELLAARTAQLQFQRNAKAAVVALCLLLGAMHGGWCVNPVNRKPLGKRRQCWAPMGWAASSEGRSGADKGCGPRGTGPTAA